MEPQLGKAAVVTCTRLLLHQAPMLMLGQLLWRTRRGMSWKWHAQKLVPWRLGARLCHRAAGAEAEAPPTTLPTCRRGEGGGSGRRQDVPPRTNISYPGVWYLVHIALVWEGYCKCPAVPVTTWRALLTAVNLQQRFLVWV